MKPSSQACPDDATLAALVTGELEHELRLAAADHIAGCSRCARDYRTLTALHVEAGGPIGRQRNRIWATGLAAVLIAVLGVALFWWGSQTPVTDSRPAVRGTALVDVQPADHAVLIDAPTFSWPPQAGATGYRVRLYDESAQTLWEGQLLQDTSAPLPADGAPALAPGAAYFWTVEVEGDVVRPQLGPFWFRMEE